MVLAPKCSKFTVNNRWRWAEPGTDSAVVVGQHGCPGQGVPEMEDEEGLWVPEVPFFAGEKQRGKGAGNAGEIRAGVIESV